MFRTIVYPVPFIVLFFASSFALAQRQSPWKAHDTKRPHPPVVVTESPRGPVAPPSDAIILFDGSDLDQWESADGSPWERAGANTPEVWRRPIACRVGRADTSGGKESGTG